MNSNGTAANEVLDKEGAALDILKELNKVPGLIEAGRELLEAAETTVAAVSITKGIIDSRNSVAQHSTGEESIEKSNKYEFY